jgi:hypothetical protein
MCRSDRRELKKFVYYETIKREINKRLIHECRCDERLNLNLRDLHVSYTKKRGRGMKVVYYESIKRDLMTRPIYECRCDERLKTKGDESTHLVYTWFLGQLEHLKIETRLIDEKFTSVMGECVI